MLSTPVSGAGAGTAAASYASDRDDAAASYAHTRVSPFVVNQQTPFAYQQPSPPLKCFAALTWCRVANGKPSRSGIACHVTGPDVSPAGAHSTSSRPALRSPQVVGMNR